MVDAAIESPMVIEGYWNSDGPTVSFGALAAVQCWSGHTLTIGPVMGAIATHVTAYVTERFCLGVHTTNVNPENVR